MANKIKIVEAAIKWTNIIKLKPNIKIINNKWEILKKYIKPNE